MTVRLPTPEDIACMHRVRLAVRENRLSHPGRVTLDDYLPAITSLGRGWVAVSDGQVAAFAVGYRSGNIWALFVEPDHEGRGHGKALHDVMVSWLWDEGLEEIWLTTGPGTRAEVFYRKHGWEESGMVDGQLRLQLQRRAQAG